MEFLGGRPVGPPKFLLFLAGSSLATEAVGEALTPRPGAEPVHRGSVAEASGDGGFVSAEAHKAAIEENAKLKQAFSSVPLVADDEEKLVG